MILLFYLKNWHKTSLFRRELYTEEKSLAREVVRNTHLEVFRKVVAGKCLKI